LFYSFSYHTFDFSAKKNFGSLKPPHENFLRTPLPLVLPISKRRQEDKVFFDEQGGKVKRYITKNCSLNCFIRNLLPAKRFSKSC